MHLFVCLCSLYFSGTHTRVHTPTGSGTPRQEAASEKQSSLPLHFPPVRSSPTGLPEPQEAVSLLPLPAAADRLHNLLCRRTDSFCRRCPDSMNKAITSTTSSGRMMTCRHLCPPQFSKTAATNNTSHSRKVFRVICRFSFNFR